MIHILPQAPLKNRYTEDWIPMWKRELDKIGISYKIVGDETLIESHGLFENFNECVKYEQNQISYVFEHINEIDKILILDTDFPGLFVPAAQLLKWKKPNIKIYGYCHAGSWNDKDIFSGSVGKTSLEIATFEIFDKIFVATEYHKNLINSVINVGRRTQESVDQNRKYINPDKIEVVGLPFYSQDIINKVDKVIPFEEKDIILINGRIEQSEKIHIELFRTCLSDERPVNKFKLKTFDDIKNRKEYFDILNRTKISISFKTAETFGLSQAEVSCFGGQILSPNKYSYPELCDDERILYNLKYIYLTSVYKGCFLKDEIYYKFKELIKLTEPIKVDLKKYEYTIPVMINKIMLGI